MFDRLKKLWHSMVAWFRPDNGGSAALTFTHYPSPPPRRKEPKHEEVPAEPEAPPPPVQAEPPPTPERIAQKILKRARSRREPDKWLHPIHKPHKPRDPDAPHKPRKPRTVLELGADNDPAVFPTGGDDEHHWDLRPQSEDTGVFYFRGALLDRLDIYFRAVARMKKAHRDAYDIYTRVGGTMIPSNSLASMCTLPAFWHTPKNRPAFGCVHVASADRNDDNMLQLLYFEKMAEPGPWIELAPGADVYEVNAYLDDLANDASERINKLKSRRWRRWLRQCGFVFQFWVAVEPDGSMRPLKTLQTDWKNITYRGNGYRGGGKTRKQVFSESIPQKYWSYPYNLRWWWKECHEQDKYHETIEEWACSTLRLIANFAQAAEFAVRISVEDAHEHRAVFALDWKRTSYFFKDRDVILTPKGKSARIFHIVRPHMRKGAGGQETAVHMHFRGLRRFKWGNYNVHITVPGLHHMPLVEFTVGMVPMQEPNDDILLDSNYIGSELAAHLDGRITEQQLFKEENGRARMASD